MAKGEVEKVLAADASSNTAKHHWSVDVKFPVYSVQFVDDRVAVLAGGGGASRSGVQNQLVRRLLCLSGYANPKANQTMYSINNEKRQLELVHQHQLAKDEDAPMTIAINPATSQIAAGINSSTDKLKEGINDNLRLFSYTKDSIKFERAHQTLASADEDQYQKVTAFNRTKPIMVAVGSTDSQISLVELPSLDDVWPSVQYEGEEIFDVDFNDRGDMLIGTSAKRLCAWPTKSPEPGDKHQPLQIIERPEVRKDLVCTFRAAKFGRKTTAKNIYTVVNANPAAKAKKGAAKKAFLSLWDSETWRLQKTRTISNKPITSFDVSDDGLLLAYGGADLSVGVLDATNLRSIITVLHAHDFPVTTLRFNPSANLLISGSADNSVRVYTIPTPGQRGTNSALWNVLLTILIVIIAIVAQRYIAPDLLRIAHSHFA